MKKLNYTIVLFMIICTSVKAQQVLITDGVSVSPTPNAQAILELRSISNNKGLLMPKVSLTSTTSPSPFSAHLAGLTVYNTNTSTVTAVTRVTPGFYYNDGSTWNKLEVQIPSIGDIKYGSTSADHEGWYLMNGRTISSLPSIAQTNAASLGFTTSLPNSSDKFLKTKTGAEVLGSTGGNSSVTLSQANLPNVTYSPTTSSNGDHNHSYNDRASGSTNSIESGSTRTAVDDLNRSGLNTSSSGAHTHTFSVSTGGSNTPLNLQPKYLSTYIFVYLGQ